MAEESRLKATVGRKPRSRSSVRSEPIRTMFRPGEAADLRAIARAWDVPLASVVWAIVHGELRRYRRAAPDHGQAALAAAAAYSVTHRSGGGVPREARPVGEELGDIPGGSEGSN